MKIKKPVKEKPVLINLKVLKADMELIVNRAKKYADGNVSMWLRYAGSNHIPKKKDLV
jgi:hypothetical protein